MTDQEQKGPPPFDPLHPSIQGTQAWLNVGRQRTPGGEILIITMRVTNATLTVVLDKASAVSWLKTIQDEVDQMSSLSIAPANMPLPPMNGRPT
jgi:hypothetical protein